jgi:hypothetical protein
MNLGTRNLAKEFLPGDGAHTDPTKTDVSNMHPRFVSFATKQKQSDPSGFRRLEPIGGNQIKKSFAQVTR